MIFEFGQYLVDIDVQKTKLFYKEAELVSEACSCDGCKNFESAMALMPQSVTSFFLELGIDMRKICECYVNETNEDGTLFYGGFYHVCGTLLRGDCAWVKIDKSLAYWEENKTFSISQGFRIAFTEDVALLEKGFPLPVLQLEISANIPWVLEKENSYIE